jgi:CRISPR-associated protein Csd2
MQHISNRYDFVFLFDVLDGNPNGDPDADDLPRIDPETGNGLVTDVCLKRKIRNFVSIVHHCDPPFDIYVREKAVLNQQHHKAYVALAIDPDYRKTEPKDRANVELELTRWMCNNFYDVRTFGAVMTTGVNCGQVRGPVQMTISRSIDPIVPHEFIITRCAVTTEREAAEQPGSNRSMGRKFTVPYALYRCHGFVSSHLAEKTGFSEQDLDLLWQALEGMFDQDRSASHGEMTARKLYVFKHDSPLGNAPAHKLFERVGIHRADLSKPPRNVSDYQITGPNQSDLPRGVIVLDRI